MEKSKQIQIGLLGLVALLLVVSLMGGFSGLFGGGGDADVRADARESLTTSSAVNNPAANAVTPNAAAAKAAEPAVPAGPTTTMNFESLEHDYGVIDAGEKVNHKYKFSNTGSEPLIISNAKGSCGCTVPNWPKEPIPPGGTGGIDVVFDSKGKKGKQSKRVTITANTSPAQTFLTIKGEVTPDPNAPAPAAAKKPSVVPQKPQ